MQPIVTLSIETFTIALTQNLIISSMAIDADDNTPTSARVCQENK
jgi:hypothetical protein